MELWFSSKFESPIKIHHIAPIYHDNSTIFVENENLAVMQT